MVWQDFEGWRHPSALQNELLKTLEAGLGADEVIQRSWEALGWSAGGHEGLLQRRGVARLAGWAAQGWGNMPRRWLRACPGPTINLSNRLTARHQETRQRLLGYLGHHDKPLRISWMHDCKRTFTAWWPPSRMKRTSSKQPGGIDVDRNREWNHGKPWKPGNVPQFKTRGQHLQITVIYKVNEHIT